MRVGRRGNTDTVAHTSPAVQNTREIQLVPQLFEAVRVLEEEKDTLGTRFPSSCLMRDGPWLLET